MRVRQCGVADLASKWDQKTMPDLYLQTIVHARDIRCLRDLKLQHVRQPSRRSMLTV